MVDKIKRVRVYASFAREFSRLSAPSSVFYSFISLPDTNALDKYEFIAALAETFA